MHLPFTHQVDCVMRMAEHEAEHFHHQYIGTEHLLLGLIRVGTGNAARILTKLGINSQEIRQEIERILQKGPNRVEEYFPFLPRTPRAEAVLTLARTNAIRLGDRAIGTKHLLLGLTLEVEGVAAQVLRYLGADAQNVGNEVAHLGLASNSWKTDKVISLAREIHQEKTFDRLPVLADALKDAGCVDEEVLGHLARGDQHGCPKPGCWALEQLLDP